MSEAPDIREQEDCPGADVCNGLCDQHEDVESTPTEREAGARPRCPGCGHSCCPYPGLECGGGSDAVQACEREAGDVGEVAALTNERNHWIGEGKRYERLYRHESENASRWFKRMKAAEAKVARVEAILVRLADDDPRYDTSYGAAGLMRLEEDLRAALERDA